MSSELLIRGAGVGFVAFAAFCVWLTVRIVNRRERWAMVLALAAVIAAGITAMVVAGVVQKLERDQFIADIESLELYSMPFPVFYRVVHDWTVTWNVWTFGIEERDYGKRAHTSKPTTIFAGAYRFETDHSAYACLAIVAAVTALLFACAAFVILRAGRSRAPGRK